MTLYTFRTVFPSIIRSSNTVPTATGICQTVNPWIVFPSIIRSSRLYIEQYLFDKCLLLYVQSFTCFYAIWTVVMLYELLLCYMNCCYATWTVVMLHELLLCYMNCCYATWTVVMLHELLLCYMNFVAVQKDLSADPL